MKHPYRAPKDLDIPFIARGKKEPDQGVPASEWKNLHVKWLSPDLEFEGDIKGLFSGDSGFGATSIVKRYITKGLK